MAWNFYFYQLGPCELILKKMNQYSFILINTNVFENDINTICTMSAIVFMSRCFTYITGTDKIRHVDIIVDKTSN